MGAMLTIRNDGPDIAEIRLPGKVTKIRKLLRPGEELRINTTVIEPSAVTPIKDDFAIPQDRCRIAED